MFAPGHPWSHLDGESVWIAGALSVNSEAAEPRVSRRNLVPVIFVYMLLPVNECSLVRAPGCRACERTLSGRLPSKMR